jgi:hypothetical protein
MNTTCDKCGEEIDGAGWERAGWIGWWGGKGSLVEKMYVAHKGCCQAEDEDWSVELAQLTHDEDRAKRLRVLLADFSWPTWMTQRLEWIAGGCERCPACQGGPMFDRVDLEPCAPGDPQCTPIGCERCMPYVLAPCSVCGRSHVQVEA